MVILREATIKYKGYDPEDLKPYSRKRVCKSCDDCGRVGYISLKSYRNLCHQCSTKGELNPNYGKHRSKETKAKISKNHADFKGKNNPMYSRDRSGNKGPNYGKFGKESSGWKGGISSKYCPKFNESCRESNREKYDRKCFICDKLEQNNNRKLSVHHIDMNKQQGCNNTNWALIPLCLQCHGMVHNDLWQSRIEYLIKDNK